MDMDHQLHRSSNLVVFIECSRAKDVSLGKVLIPKFSECYDDKTKEIKLILKIVDGNEMAFIELVL
jgi:hypothetical protein